MLFIFDNAPFVSAAVILFAVIQGKDKERRDKHPMTKLIDFRHAKHPKQYTFHNKWP